jgi:predicted flavoprotein YhiN
MTRNSKTVLVVGGGAAGMMAALAAAERGAHVTVLERMDKVGKENPCHGERPL